MIGFELEKQKEFFSLLSQRILMTPGPSQVHPEVLKIMAYQACSSDDPVFISMEREIRTLLKESFRTDSDYVYVISGGGSIGMEASLFNIVEPNDKILICENGIFGSRQLEISERAGAIPIVIKADWGEPLEPAAIRNALKKNPDIKAVSMVHGETSTGVLSDVQTIGKIVSESNAIFIVDAHTTLFGSELEFDKWNIDVCYSGSQKCLSAPSGLSPIAYSPKAIEAVYKRKSKCVSWFSDVKHAFQNNNGSIERRYHHTAPSHLLYGMYGALNILKDEGWKNVISRHKVNGLNLRIGLQQMGIEMLVKEEHFLPQVHAVKIPQSLNVKEVINFLRDKCNIVVGEALGPLKKDYIRIGLIGYGSNESNVNRVLESFEYTLNNI